MPLTILNAIRKPLGSNKRLLGLTTIALLIIGVLATSYWYKIKYNEKSFKEYKLQTLDSYFNIISKRFTNDIQTFDSKLAEDFIKDKDEQNKNFTSPEYDASTEEEQKVTATSSDEDGQEKDCADGKENVGIWDILTSVNSTLPHDNEFDAYIVRFKTKDNGTNLEPKYLSSLAGSFQNEIDSLLIDNQLNIGVSNAIPEEDPRYRFFGREYQYKGSVCSRTWEIDIAIIGLIGADSYKASTRRLNSWIITLLVTFLLLCLFGLPFFKLVFIAEDERLNSKDIIMAGTSILVGAPIMIVIFLSLLDYFDSREHTIPDRLRSFAETLVTDFTEENDTIIRRLDRFDFDSYDPENCHTDYCICKEKFKPLKDIDPDSLRFSFKYISKMYDDGNVCYTLNSVRRPKDHLSRLNLKERIYFKDLKKGSNVWKIGDDISYVMRPVVSIEDQKEEAVYIVQDGNKSNHFKVGSSQLSSVHNPIVPFGYQYAIIDHLGEVWFHSKIGRSTLENFFAVSRQSGDLRAAVKGRVAAQGVMKYRDESQIFYVDHIEGTNLSVIALYDLSLLRIRISEVLSITGMSIFFVLLLMALIALFSVLRGYTDSGLYKFKVFPFEFLTPKEKNEENYILLSTLFLGVLAIAVPLSMFVSFLPSSSFILSFLFISWSYLLVYYSFNPKAKGNKLGLRMSDALLLGAIFLLDILLLRLGSQIIWILLVVLPVQILCSIYLFKMQKIEDHRTAKNWIKFVKRKMKVPFPKNYILFLFCWLLLASVLPTTLFFKKAREINDLIWTKTEQFHMSKEFLQKINRLKEKLPAPESDTVKFDDIYSYHLQRGQYLGTVSRNNRDTLEVNNYEHDNLRKLLWSTRPIYDEKIRDFQAMIYRRSLDETWKSEENGEDIVFQMDEDGRPTKLLVTQSPSTMDTDNKRVLWPRLGLKAIGLLGILALLYTVISFFIDRFIGFRFMNLKPNDFDTNSNKEYIPKFAKVLSTGDANSGLLLTGLPFSGKTTFAEEVLQAAGCEHPVILSMMKLDDLRADSDIFEIIQKLRKTPMTTPESEENEAFEPVNGNEEEKPTASIEEHLRKECAFIIENLEHHLMSYEANRIKLRLISFLISLDKPVVLCSEVYPSQILGFYQNSQTDSEELSIKLVSDFNAWRNILSAFPQVLIGITNGEEKVKKAIHGEQDEGIKQLVADELGFGKFLPTLAPVIHAKNLVESPDEEDRRFQIDEQRMVMHTQNLSHGYYTDIWNSLPTRERYMLYDLAKDGFLNIKNGNSLFSLMKKGLIIWKDRPAIFNHSFKNFISSSVSLNEALRLEHKNRGEGSWGTMRVIFYLIILTIIVLIFLGEPGLLKDFEALVGALGGIGVVIPLLSALLARSGQKE